MLHSELSVGGCRKRSLANARLCRYFRGVYLIPFLFFCMGVSTVRSVESRNSKRGRVSNIGVTLSP